METRVGGRDANEYKNWGNDVNGDKESRVRHSNADKMQMKECKLESE